MSLVEDKKIVFCNKAVSGIIRKTAYSETNESDISHVVRFTDIELINEFISSLDMAINGDFGLIDDPDISTDDQIAFIAETNIEFFDQNGQYIIGYAPLQEFKEMFTAWRDFLLEPPFHGSKVDDNGNPA